MEVAKVWDNKDEGIRVCNRLYLDGHITTQTFLNGKAKTEEKEVGRGWFMGPKKWVEYMTVVCGAKIA
jgi:hypothetical protein